MDLGQTKAVYFAIMFAVTIVCGLAPVKMLVYLRSRTNSIATFASVISILSCFSGGVFLGVCLLDMLPEAMESFEEYRKAAAFEYDLPVVPMIIGCVTSLAPSLSLPRLEDQKLANHGRSLSTPTSEYSTDTLDLTPRVEGRGAYLKSLTFITAFLLHVSLEGFALGVQKDELAGLSLFIGILLHKGIAAFSIGTRLHANHPRNGRFVVAMLVLVATVTTLGGVAGMLVEGAEMDVARKAAVETVLTSISIGTFLYITFFEILGSEKGTLGQRLAALVGFVVIGATVLIVE
ncbi:zipt-2.3 [Pristionchus pacificus]|uniref:Uncharacterized protein n=1 Tax=Pristionchus pacificus TaxID=54126 RepID=A0A2A6CXC7_PRIPA|nr:zipt-2.3 [Pristionchus pacificus]|eukprot:PDM82788.1 hypothetical protein PRIPAC_37181 [Pristionchus pacificus]